MQLKRRFLFVRDAILKVYNDENKNNQEELRRQEENVFYKGDPEGTNIVMEKERVMRKSESHI